MAPFPIYLNEKSTDFSAMTPGFKTAAALQLINALRAIKNYYDEISLVTERPLRNIELGTGGGYLHEIIGGDEYRLEWEFLSNLFNFSPWETIVISHSPHEIIYGGVGSISMTFAYSRKSAVLSFLNNGGVWNNNLLNALLRTMDEHGAITNTPEDIKNVCTVVHAADWETYIRGYDSDPTKSSVIYRTQNYRILMYLHDHPSPHFHVKYSGDEEARIDIKTLDTLSGQLPPRIAKLVKKWAKQKKEQLLENWERCEKGERPQKIV